MAKNGLPSVRSVSVAASARRSSSSSSPELGRQQCLDALAVEPAQREGVRRRPTRWMSASTAPERVRAVDLGVPVGAEHAQAAARVLRRGGGAAGRRSMAPPSADHPGPAGPLGPQRRVAAGPSPPSNSRACSSAARPGSARRRRWPGPGAGSRRRGPPRGPPPPRGRAPARPASQRLGEGLVRHRQVLLAATEQHQRTFVVGPAGQRRHQPGLAHPRFTPDEHRPSLPSTRRLEAALSPSSCAPRRPPAPPGVAANAAGRDRPLGSRELDPDPVRRHRLGEALQDQLADRLECMAAPVARRASAPCR